MSQEPQPPRSGNITIFETEDGLTRVEVRFDHENVWLTQKLMADLYECSPDNVSLHLKNIFADKELDESAVPEDSSVTAADGKGTFMAKRRQAGTVLAAKRRRKRKNRKGNNNERHHGTV